MSHRFAVWAPDATEVTLQLVAHPGPRAVAMHAGDGGWWHADVDDAGPGTDHLYAIDGGEGRPDPRSAWQPHGVHGPSRLVDHDAHRWHDEDFEVTPLNRAVVYELHLGTFSGLAAPGGTGDEGLAGGTWSSAVDRLDHLVDLGVTHIEVMPVATFAGRWGWGYDGVDLYAPHPQYGSPDDMKAFVDACHQRGLGVLLDVVYNHLGPEGNHLGAFGPYFTDDHTTPWGPAVNLNGPGSTEVRRFIVDNALMWLRDYHLDGLRLDAVHALIDTNAVHILEQIATEVAELGDQLGRRLVLVAESDRNDPRMIEARAAGGMGIDAHWNDDFHHAVHVALTAERDSYYADYGGLTPLAEALSHAYVYRGQFSEHRDRHHGRRPEGALGHSFVGYVQNHDQIGNRARGERAGQLLSPRRLKIAAAVVLTSPFVPMLFQGEEWGASAPFPFFADHRDDPQLAEAVRKGRMEEFASFGWAPTDVADPEDPATFRSAILAWDERADPPNAELLAWYRALIALRRREPSLLDGRLDLVTVAVDETRATLLYRRGDIAVALNLARDERTVPVPSALPEPELLIASDPQVSVAGPGLVLPSDSVAVIRA